MPNVKRSFNEKTRAIGVDALVLIVDIRILFVDYFTNNISRYLGSVQIWSSTTSSSLSISLRILSK